MLGIYCLRMPLEDFVSNFSELIICRLFNTNIFTISRTWCEMVIKGNWSVGAKGTSQDRSGGGPTFTDTYLRNPQVYKCFLFVCRILGFCSSKYEICVVGCGFASLGDRCWMLGDIVVSLILRGHSFTF
jgi:hypothetical protein